MLVGAMSIVAVAASQLGSDGGDGPLHRRIVDARGMGAGADRRTVGLQPVAALLIVVSQGVGQQRQLDTFLAGEGEPAASLMVEGLLLL